MNQSGNSQSLRRVIVRLGLECVPPWGLIAVAAALTSLGGFAIHGFDENGFRLGSRLAWRFAFGVYFVAIIMGPASRLIPSQKFRRRGGRSWGRQLVWGFCASFGIYLASLIVPNTLTQPSFDHQGLTLGMALFAIFGAALTMAVAYAAVPRRGLGEGSRRAILGAGLGYFWLAYLLTGLAHLSGSHRSDAFYGLSVMAMLAALVARLVDTLLVEKRGRNQAFRR